MIVSHFEDGKVEPSRTMVPHVELDYRTLPCRPQDHALSRPSPVVASLQPASFPFPAALSEGYAVG